MNAHGLLTYWSGRDHACRSDKQKREGSFTLLKMAEPEAVLVLLCGQGQQGLGRVIQGICAGMSFWKMCWQVGLLECLTECQHKVR